MKTISALTLYQKLDSVLDEVVKQNEVIIVTRANKPWVVIHSYESYTVSTNQGVYKGL